MTKYTGKYVHRCADEIHAFYRGFGCHSVSRDKINFWFHSQIKRFFSEIADKIKYHMIVNFINEYMPYGKPICGKYSFRRNFRHFIVENFGVNVIF